MGSKSKQDLSAAEANRTSEYPGPRVGAILESLGQAWGHAECELNHKTPFELLVATVLSAQSTDKQVNLITPALFALYPTANEMAKAPIDELETLVHSTGFFRQKAKNLLATAQILVQKHGGEIPTDMEALVALPGVARKTANVVLSVAFKITEGIVVDTHVMRLSSRLGLSSAKGAKSVEKELMGIIPKLRWIDFSQQLIWHGRRICSAKKPNCQDCNLAPHCPSRVL